jgi:hypothetical protein
VVTDPFFADPQKAPGPLGAAVEEEEEVTKVNVQQSKAK